MATTAFCGGGAAIDIVYQGGPCHKPQCTDDCGACNRDDNDVVAIARVRETLAKIEESDMECALGRLFF